MPTVVEIEEICTKKYISPHPEVSLRIYVFLFTNLTTNKYHKHMFQMILFLRFMKNSIRLKSHFLKLFLFLLYSRLNSSIYSQDRLNSRIDLCTLERYVVSISAVIFYTTTIGNKLHIFSNRLSVLDCAYIDQENV